MAKQSAEDGQAKSKWATLSHNGYDARASAGSSTKATVINAAMTVLARDGHANFTVRRVAKEAGISSGHMMYHYATKKLLLQALILARLQQDEEDISRVVCQHTNPAARAGALMRYHINIGLDDFTNRLFRQFHAVAAQDATVSQLLSGYYERTIVVAIDAIWQSDPAVSKDRVAAAVQLMAAIAEGAGLLHGLPLNRVFHPELVADHASTLLGSFLRNPP